MLGQVGIRKRCQREEVRGQLAEARKKVKREILSFRATCHIKNTMNFFLVIVTSHSLRRKYSNDIYLKICTFRVKQNLVFSINKGDDERIKI